MRGKLRLFEGDESGAISVDYVVLAVAIIALGLSAANAVRLGTFQSNSSASEVAKTSGCVTTGESGTTDLSKCN